MQPVAFVGDAVRSYTMACSIRIQTPDREREKVMTLAVRNSIVSLQVLLLD